VVLPIGKDCFFGVVNSKTGKKRKSRVDVLRPKKTRTISRRRQGSHTGTVMEKGAEFTTTRGVQEGGKRNTESRTCRGRKKSKIVFWPGAEKINQQPPRYPGLRRDTTR